MDPNSGFLQIPEHKYPRHNGTEVAELIQRRNRIGTRWYYSMDDVPYIPRRHKKRKHSSARKHEVEFETEHNDTPEPTVNCIDPSLDSNLYRHRDSILSHHDAHSHYKTRCILKTYATYDQSYGMVNLVRNKNKQSCHREPKMDTVHFYLSRELALQRRNNSDPAYLAPFCDDALDIGKDDTFASQKTSPNFQRPWHGNCLICLPCPCPNCRSEPSWCLLHPKGLMMDTLCMSNLIPPNGKENAGHLFSTAVWTRDLRKRETSAAARRFIPNQLCLDDTILEIHQSGLWDLDHHKCIFVVRTVTHISVVSVSVSKPDLALYDSKRKDKCDYDEDMCWGNYVLEEKTRLDLRSLVRSVPSYRPISLACHPKYGNDFTSAKFAFLSQSQHNGDQNIIHHFNVDANDDEPTIHPISSLRHISLIDFTKTDPMVLWCAASAYVRPSLVSEINFRTQYPLGFGTSLYNVDLRANSSIFQWSPSAEEMKPEGIYSISGLLTDWDRNHTVWVHSRSAGKTWELDSRMPCKAVNSWSLSSGCNVDGISFSDRGPHGDPYLFVKIKEHVNDRVWTDANSVLTVDTTPGSYGFELLQRPLHKPRFQTESLECISMARSDDEMAKPSIATTSVFAMPSSDTDVFTCGMAAFRTPLRSFVSEEDSCHFQINNDSNMLCTISMNNQGDIICHSLLETSQEVAECKSFPGLPAGMTAIPIPAVFDGKTKTMEHKRWKPTGGMNLKLFWTNHFPIPRDALRFVRPTATKRVRLARKVADQHLSYRTGINAVPHEVLVPPNNAGIRITSKSDLIQNEGVPLVIPKKFVDKAMKTRLRFSQEEMQQDGDQENKTKPRSDLHTGLISKVADAWEVWEKLDESSSEE